MKIYIRADGDKNIGTGHIMRCLTLALQLKKHEADVAFISHENSRHLEDMVRSHGIDVFFLPDSTPCAKPEQIMAGDDMLKDAANTCEIIKKEGGADLVIIDHYGIDFKWENALREVSKKIMVIDDLANRKHDCDILLDQNFYIDAQSRYDGLVPDACIRLLGPAYALLRDEFTNLPARKFNEQVENIVISFGGSDPDNFTGRVLEILSNNKYLGVNINVVAGVASAHKDVVEDICLKHSNMHFHYQIDYMAKLMNEADLFIGAGGATSLERVAIGLPSIVIAIADNQQEVCDNLAKADLAKYAGNKNDFDIVLFEKILDGAIDDINWRKQVLEKSCEYSQVSGAGKVCAYIKSFDVELKRAEENDSENIYNWRNHPDNRKFSNDSSQIDFAEHNAWFSNSLTNNKRDLLIGCIGNIAIGVVRFDRDVNNALISIYMVPQFHGKRLGLPLLLSSLEWIKKHYPDIKNINAEVIKENISSLKTFERADFEHYRDNGTKITMSKTL